MKACITAAVISKNIPPVQPHNKADIAIQSYSKAITLNSLLSDTWMVLSHPLFSFQLKCDLIGEVFHYCPIKW